MESVYAAADGWVLQAGERLEHPYGAQVRVQHRRPDGVYITVYGCLMPGSPVARAGEFVRAGQALGRAGSDGFVHFMLRKEEARNGPYGDILDPSPHLRIAP
jgi:murein DD-endopeptidase MepM/ murein hydrolase activator NlpD